MGMTVDEIKSEIKELAERINQVGAFEMTATCLPEEQDYLSDLNRAADNYREWCEEVLAIRQDQHSRLSLEGHSII